MKKVTYTDEQILTVKVILNRLTTTGIQNAKNIAVIAQTLDEGTQEEVEEKEGESSGNAKLLQKNAVEKSSVAEHRAK